MVGRVLALFLCVACSSQPAAPRGWIEVDSNNLTAHLRAEREPFLLVNVWSTWCEPCVAELPDVIRFAHGYHDRGLGLVLISADAPSQRNEAQYLLQRHEAPWPSWIKRGPDDAFVEALYPEWSGALPATFLLDSRRHVVHFWDEPVDEAALRGPIEQALRSGGR